MPTAPAPCGSRANDKRTTCTVSKAQPLHRSTHTHTSWQPRHACCCAMYVQAQPVLIPVRARSTGTVRAHETRRHKRPSTYKLWHLFARKNGGPTASRKGRQVSCPHACALVKRALKKGRLRTPFWAAVSLTPTRPEPPWNVCSLGFRVFDWSISAPTAHTLFGMCRECVRSERPDRGSMCLDSGAFFLNFLGCASCQAVQLTTANKEVAEDDIGNETVAFMRA